MSSKVFPFIVPLPHITAVNADGERCPRPGQRRPFTGTAVDEGRLFLTEFSFGPLSNLMQVVANARGIDLRVKG